MRKRKGELQALEKGEKEIFSSGFPPPPLLLAPHPKENSPFPFPF